jgi:hypothetical protein
MPHDLHSQSCLNSEHVRLFLLDRSVQDNVLELDLAFSDPEILDAMNNCARDYNSIPPLGVSTVSGNLLPGNSTLFLNGTCKWLYLSALQKLMRNDMDFDVGGVKASIESKRIEHFTNLVKLFGEEFQSQARTLKRAMNLRLAFGPVG